MVSPDLSVVLVTPNDYGRIRKVMRCLGRQTVRVRLEIIIVAPSLEGLPEDNTEWHVFSAVRRVAAGEFRNTGHPRADGAREATAPLIAFAEDHCFPEPGWAEALIRLHGGPWAAVGPAVANANPGRLSWADLLLNFGPAVLAASSGEASYTPWHNTSYKRALLDEYGDRLEHMLEAEIRLQQDLIKRGHLLYLAAGIRTHHINQSRLVSFIAGQFWGGRIYAAARAEAAGWSRVRRLFYGATSPLLPLVRLPRVLRDLRRAELADAATSVLPFCMIGLLASTCGEMAGYTLGAGAAGRRRIFFEYHRREHVRVEDLPLLECD